MIFGSYLTPCDQMCLLSLVSTRTSFVPICFSANFLISLMALGARYLKPMPWSRLCKLTVYSRVTTSPMVEPLPFFSPFLGDISKQTAIKKTFRRLKHINNRHFVSLSNAMSEILLDFDFRKSFSKNILLTFKARK